MGKIAESLKENLEHILKEIPADFHEDAKKAAASAEDAALLSVEQEIEAIKTEAKFNPGVDEDAIGDVDENTVKAHQPPPPLTPEQQEAAMAVEMKNFPQPAEEPPAAE